MDLGAIDGVVGGDVEVVEVGWDLETFWYIVIYGICRRCNGVCVAKSFCFFEGLLCPHAGLKIRSLVLKEVHGGIKESQACTSSEEYYLMGVRNIQKFLPERTAFIHDGFPLLCTVRY